MSLSVYLNDAETGEELFWKNITHNLGQMAKEVDLYMPLWRPEEIGIERARDLIGPLSEGLKRLIAERARLKSEFSPHNGWGTHGGLVDFVVEYSCACCDYPDAKVEVSR